ncbi:MAG: CopG family transcriptional regulator [Caulobacteraceae bacterium]|nr:CopG family transcriptional regulator [Caulobacteraceae bacterium]
MEIDQRLMPYSVYLPKDLIEEIRNIAKARGASEFIRNAIANAVAGNNAYSKGFNDGLISARDLVLENTEANSLLVGKARKTLADTLADGMDS